MFALHTIDHPYTLEELSKSIKFEDITKGRQGAISVDYRNDSIPIIRTTTKYNEPVQRFLPVHYDLIENIKKIVPTAEFNNAMIELYDSQYSTMGFHTDQSLDLETNSYICLYSCYNNPQINARKLVIKNKTTAEVSEIRLENNSIVIFSTQINHQYLHKIVLDSGDNKWLGITFRLSKTLIKFINEIPYFANGMRLTMATDNEKKTFYELRSLENQHVECNYPEINYTISISDTLQIK